MISNQKLLVAIREIKEITGIDVTLYLPNGKLVAETGGTSEAVTERISLFAESDIDQIVVDTYTLYKVSMDDNVEFVLCMRDVRPEGLVIGQMAVCQIRNLLLSFAEKFDRNNFMQNLLLGNMLAVDLFSRAKKLHIEAKPRVAFVIHTGKKNNDIALELVRNLSDMRTGDFVTSVDPHHVVLIKDVSNINGKDMEDELSGIANRLVDNLHMEAMIKVRVGYGNVVGQINELAQSYQEARMALEVGRVFYAQKDTISYSRLGIGRLIYQLPMSLCEMFIKEVFGEKIPEILDDEEAMSTINKFFDNNLNISETARQLYVHRNTLVYRLERIEKAIGLDIRSFDDAMTFRIAVMVLAHMRDSERG